MQENAAPLPPVANVEAIRSATVNALASVAVGRGRLAAARTVKDHVRAAITLCELEQRAAYILHMGAYAMRIATPKPERLSNES